jgi:hypothetical protein
MDKSLYACTKKLHKVGLLTEIDDMGDLAGSLHTALADADGNKCLVTDVFRPQDIGSAESQGIVWPESR